MNRKTIELGIKIEIENADNFLHDIAREYDCEINEITHDDIIEYLNSNIKAHSTGNFNIIGFETDGYGINRANTEELEEIISTYTD